MFEIKKVRGFSSNHDYTAFSVIRIHSKVIKQLGGRNTWVKISHADKHIYRMALGAKPSKGFTMESVELDYDSCLELECISNSEKDETNFYPCSLTIQKAPFFGKLIAHWKHPNPGYRVPMQLSMVSFSLGLIGVLISIIGYA
jgi:hypothetical protein